MMETKPILKYPGYLAREDGAIIHPEGKVLTQFINDNNYREVYIDKRRLCVHELVLTAFEPNHDEKFTIANHFDLDRSNNAFSNLDWVDAEWNNIHHVLMLKKNPNRPHIRTFIEGEKKLFNTLDECAEYFNKSLKETWLCLKEGKEIETGIVLKYLKWDDVDVLNIVREETIRRKCEGFGGKREVKLLDLRTNEVKHYPSMGAAANDLGLLLTHIRNRISTPKCPKILAKRYIVSDIDGNFDYLTDEIKMKLLDRGGKPVVVHKLHTEHYKVFRSAYAFIKECGLKLQRAAVTKNLQLNKISETRGYIYAYLPDEHKDNYPGYLTARYLEYLTDKK